MNISVAQYRSRGDSSCAARRDPSTCASQWASPANCESVDRMT
jgi:hypothetical protein